ALFRDFEIRFVYFDGNQPRRRVHSVEHPRRRHASARAEFQKLAGGLRRRKRAEQTAREQGGSHGEIQARGIRHKLRESRREFDVFRVVHSDSKYCGRPSSLPNSRKCGEDIATITTTISVPTPPLTTEKIGPNSAATVPDSNRPSSFDALMNIPLT